MTDEPVQLAYDLRLVVGRLVRRVRSDDPRPSTVTHVLGLLGRDGAMTTSELASSQRVRPQSMARTVGQLLADGLVEKRPHPTDGRKSPVALTAAGRAALEDERSRRTDWLATAVASSLSADERRTLARAVELLARLTDGTTS